MDRFQGLVVHPQRWPQDLDLAGKRVVVIGSGATAATLIPAIAEKAEHVTMLQRSPSYFYAPPTTHELAVMLGPLDLPDEWMHEILRRRTCSGGRDSGCRCDPRDKEVRLMVTVDGLPTQLAVDQVPSTTRSVRPCPSTSVIRSWTPGWPSRAHLVQGLDVRRSVRQN